MRFTIAKPADKMSFGDLFFTAPDGKEIKSALLKLEQECRALVDKEVPLNRNHPERIKLMSQVEKEINMIEVTGQTYSILIMKEIANLSRELGYPTTVLGQESGLIILYLLGVSGIHPSQFNYSTIPSEMVYDSGLFDNSLSFTLAIAEPVRERIHNRLNRVFGKVKCCNSIYSKISLPDSRLLEQIGEYGDQSGVNYSDIDLEDADLLRAVCDQLCCDQLHRERNFDYPESSFELARLYAYAVCSSENKDHFSTIKNYVFRDDIYQALTKTTMAPPKRLPFSRNWSQKIEKEKDTQMLKRYGLPDKLIDVYTELENLWPATSCLARVNSMLMVKFYEKL